MASALGKFCETLSLTVNKNLKRDVRILSQINSRCIWVRRREIQDGLNSDRSAVQMWTVDLLNTSLQLGQYTNLIRIILTTLNTIFLFIWSLLLWCKFITSISASLTWANKTYFDVSLLLCFAHELTKEHEKEKGLNIANYFGIKFRTVQP
jgi:hypothetical protein